MRVGRGKLNSSTRRKCMSPSTRREAWQASLGGPFRRAVQASSGQARQAVTIGHRSIRSKRRVQTAQRLCVESSSLRSDNCSDQSWETLCVLHGSSSSPISVLSHRPPSANPQRCRDLRRGTRRAQRLETCRCRRAGATARQVMGLPQVSNANLQLGLGDLEIGERPMVQLSLETAAQCREDLLGRRELPQAN